MKVIDWYNRELIPDNRRKEYFKEYFNTLPTPEMPDVSYVKYKYLDIPYATISDTERLDIYLPNNEKGPFPVLVYIHGGGYRGGNKRNRHIPFLLKSLEHNFAVISVAYSKSMEALFPRQIYEVKAAIRWIKANSSLYNLNPDQITLIGSSAGAHLAALVGTSWNENVLDDFIFGHPEISCKVQIVIDWFAPINFLTCDSQFKKSNIEKFVLTNPESSYASLLFGCSIEKIPQLVHYSNPEIYINSESPSFLIQHGTLDSFVPLQQSIDFYEKLKSVIGPQKVELDFFEGAGHGTYEFLEEANLLRILDFINSHR